MSSPGACPNCLTDLTCYGLGPADHHGAGGDGFLCERETPQEHARNGLALLGAALSHADAQGRELIDAATKRIWKTIEALEHRSQQAYQDYIAASGR